MQKEKYFSLLLDWGDDTNEYGWSGLARNGDHAIHKARRSMSFECLGEQNSELSEDEILETGGHVIELVEGASMWEAGRAADFIEELIARGRGATTRELMTALAILRP